MNWWGGKPWGDFRLDSFTSLSCPLLCNSIRHSKDCSPTVIVKFALLLCNSIRHSKDCSPTVIVKFAPLPALVTVKYNRVLVELAHGPTVRHAQERYPSRSHRTVEHQFTISAHCRCTLIKHCKPRSVVQKPRHRQSIALPAAQNVIPCKRAAKTSTSLDEMWKLHILEALCRKLFVKHNLLAHHNAR
jgi:hypothetical protein